MNDGSRREAAHEQGATHDSSAVGVRADRPRRWGSKRFGRADGDMDRDHNGAPPSANAPQGDTCRVLAAGVRPVGWPA